MFSLVGVARCMRVAEEGVELNEAFADLARKWRSCDVPFLEALQIGETI